MMEVNSITVKSHRLWSEITVWILTLSLSSFVNMDKFLNSSVTQFPHVTNVDNYSTYIRGSWKDWLNNYKVFRTGLSHSKPR